MNRQLLFLLSLSLMSTAVAKADSAGVFTYQGGSFATIPNSALDTPLGISSSGAILLASNGNIGDPVLLDGGTVTSISVPGATTEAYSMSPNGTILGSYITNTRVYFTDLGGSFSTVNLPGSPRTTGNALINDNGQVILSNFSCCNLPDFIYNINTSSMTPVSFPGAAATSLIAINNKGQVLGVASGGAVGIVYFLYSGGSFTTLVFPSGCSPVGINDNDEIVGNCIKNGSFQGFLLSPGVFTYINYDGNSSFNNTLISDINDSGEIVGTFADVPEPITVSQLYIGLVVLAGLYLHRKRSSSSRSTS